MPTSRVPLLVVALALLAPVAAVAGAAWALDRPIGSERWLDRQAALDPPSLWQAQAIDGEFASAPVTVCADGNLHAGFLRPMPTSGTGQCVPIDDRPVQISPYRIRCRLNGHRLQVTTRVQGDPQRDFTVAFEMRGLDAPIPVQTQVRRYRRLGACPPDWSIGDHTDRNGRRRSHVAG
jgi:hypothetical protein